MGREGKPIWRATYIAMRGWIVLNNLSFAATLNVDFSLVTFTNLNYLSSPLYFRVWGHIYRSGFYYIRSIFMCETPSLDIYCSRDGSLSLASINPQAQLTSQPGSPASVQNWLKEKSFMSLGNNWIYLALKSLWRNAKSSDVYCSIWSCYGGNDLGLLRSQSLSLYYLWI
jgi:hypothetical protein